MLQIFKSSGSGPAPDVETISGEGGAPVLPDGFNFNFSGSIAGGSVANGAILFSTPSVGQVDAVVQTDDITITINASNQLQVIEPLVWQIIAASQGALIGAGYFINVGQTVTLTLPSGASIGETFAVYALTGATWILQCQAGQQIQVNEQISSLGGTVTSTKTGDFIYVKAVTATAFVAIPFSGNFIIT